MCDGGALYGVTTIATMRALVGDPTLPEVSYGTGPWLREVSGQWWLDGSSGAMAAALGHGIDELADALAAQARSVAFAHRTQWRNAAAERLADTLANRAPDPLRRVLLCSSGSEANEAACKLAVRRQQAAGHTQRRVIVGRDFSYHGTTLAAQSATGHPSRREPDLGWLREWPHFPAPRCRTCRHDLSTASCGDDSLDELERLLASRDDIAAVLCETVGAAASGVLVPTAGYHERLRELCSTYGVLWIADEVVAGAGRTGRFYGIEHWDAVPDILTLGKGISGGYAPAAAVLTTDEVVDSLTAAASGLPMVGHTWSAVPLTAAAALATTDYIDTHGLVGRAAHMGRLLRARLRERVDEVLAGRVLVRGLGLLAGVELLDEDGRPLPATWTAQIVAAARAEHLLVYPSAACAGAGYGAAVVVAPPLTIDESTVDVLVDRLARVLVKVRDSAVFSSG